MFISDQPGAINIIDSVIKFFDLNSEQERAFRIIVNHATIDNPTQLKMYLGGMGGTGTSQVLKALMEFFKETSYYDISTYGFCSSIIKWFNL